MMTETFTQSIQDYLKHIYELNENGNAASTTELAARLNIAPASVTGMLQKLATANPPLVEYQKYQGVWLTHDGRKAALEVIRHHRLLETYLVQALGFQWDEVHAEACRLEHVISEDFEARIAAVMGNPRRDPHGALIPDSDLFMPKDESSPLSYLRVADRATIIRVDDQDSALLRYLGEIGMVPGARFLVLDYNETDGELTILVDGQTSSVRLALEVTRQVFVSPEAGNF